MNMKKIWDCELAYSKCFSEYVDELESIRFYDNKITDMYSHNFTYIKKPINEYKLKKLIEDEIAKSKLESKSFCNIILAGSFMQQIGMTNVPEITEYGFYVRNNIIPPQWSGNNDCQIIKVDSWKKVEDIVALDSEQYHNWGSDFCKRRAHRNGLIYLAKDGVNSYICYDKGIAVGKCDLFIINDIAKIEDFDVLPRFQRKGYGTALMQFIVNELVLKNVPMVYLVTDESDTAKEMYIKLGFHKVGLKTQLFFKI